LKDFTLRCYARRMLRDSRKLTGIDANMGLIASSQVIQRDTHARRNGFVRIALAKDTGILAVARLHGKLVSVA